VPKDTLGASLCFRRADVEEEDEDGGGEPTMTTAVGTHVTDCLGARTSRGKTVFSIFFFLVPCLPSNVIFLFVCFQIGATLSTLLKMAHGEFDFLKASTSSSSSSSSSAAINQPDEAHDDNTIANDRDEEMDDHGDVARQTIKLPGAAESLFGKTTALDNMVFLNRAPWTRATFLKLCYAQVYTRELLQKLVFLKPDEIVMCARFPQGRKWWEWSRKGRRTGTAFAVGLSMSPHKRPCRGAFASQYLKTVGSEQNTRWGNDTEKFGAQKYVNHLTRLVVSVFRAQRRMGYVARTGCFVFRNQRIRVPDINVDPVVELCHFGQLVDFWNQWMGTSNDGVVIINGLPVGIFENKSPAPRCTGVAVRDPGVATCDPDRLRASLKMYSYMPEEYFCQLQMNLYIAHRYWPTVRWADFNVYTPFTSVVETVPFYSEWFNDWAIPRDLKFCSLLLRLLAERVRHAASAVAPFESPPSMTAYRAALKQDFEYPDEPLPKIDDMDANVDIVPPSSSSSSSSSASIATSTVASSSSTKEDEPPTQPQVPAAAATNPELYDDTTPALEAATQPTVAPPPAVAEETQVVNAEATQETYVPSPPTLVIMAEARNKKSVRKRQRLTQVVAEAERAEIAAAAASDAAPAAADETEGTAETTTESSSVQEQAAIDDVPQPPPGKRLKKNAPDPVESEQSEAAPTTVENEPQEEEVSVIPETPANADAADAVVVVQDDPPPAETVEPADEE